MGNAELREELEVVKAENEVLYRKLGIESDRMKTDREEKEAEERREDELRLKTLERTEKAAYIEALEKSNGVMEWDAQDRMQEVIRHSWGEFLKVRAARAEAKRDIEAWREQFGGQLPESWEQARVEWVNKQPRRPEPSSGGTVRRIRVFQLLQQLFGGV